jgi:hypothetical protein
MNKIRSTCNWYKYKSKTWLFQKKRCVHTPLLKGNTKLDKQWDMLRGKGVLYSAVPINHRGVTNVAGQNIILVGQIYTLHTNLLPYILTKNVYYLKWSNGSKHTASNIMYLVLCMPTVSQRNGKELQTAPPMSRVRFPVGANFRDLG